MDKARFKRLARPPQTALKTIQAGRLKGKSDINPQWRYEAMNDEFGPCGEGWSYEIVDLWNVPGANEEVFAFAKVMVHTVEGGKGIPGIGGSMLVANERNGLYNNDEAFKMAVTDALSVALKMLGVASDIYMGLWDGTKYRESSKPESSKSIGQADYDRLEEADKRMVDGVAEEIIAVYNSKGVADAYNTWKEYKEFVKDRDNAIELETSARGKLPSHVRTAFGKFAQSL